jgi:hypothetical protein
MYKIRSVSGFNQGITPNDCMTLSLARGKPTLELLNFIKNSCKVAVQEAYTARLEAIRPVQALQYGASETVSTQHTALYEEPEEHSTLDVVAWRISIAKKHAKYFIHVYRIMG